MIKRPALIYGLALTVFVVSLMVANFPLCGNRVYRAKEYA